MIKFLSRLFVAALFVSVVLIVIAYARGYHLNLSDKKITPSGILAIKSSPETAKVWLNGEIKGITNLNLTLPPKKYSVKITKEGYSSWQKEVNLKKEVVVNLNALLFPNNPTLSPLTNLGVKRALPIDQTGKILFLVEKGDQDKDGLYIFDSNRKPISLGQPLTTVLLTKNLHQEEISLAEAKIYFSPKFDQIILEAGKKAYLLSLTEKNISPFEVTRSEQNVLEAWQLEKRKQVQKILETFPREFAKIASASFTINSFSPDNNKIFYQAKKNLSLPLIITPPLIGSNQTPQSRKLRRKNFYVYDKKEDKNFAIKFVAKKGASLPVWYPDSNHLVYLEKGRIVIVESDGTNKQTVYSGPFQKGFFGLNNDGEIVTLINLNPETNPYADLYLVGIR